MKMSENCKDIRCPPDFVEKCCAWQKRNIPPVERPVPVFNALTEWLVQETSAYIEIPTYSTGP